MKCPNCNGNGKLLGRNEEYDIDCPLCDGDGEFADRRASWNNEERRKLVKESDVRRIIDSTDYPTTSSIINALIDELKLPIEKVRPLPKPKGD